MERPSVQVEAQCGVVLYLHRHAVPRVVVRQYILRMAVVRQVVLAAIIPVVSHHPSDISHLKKFVPLSTARCITFVAANNVRKGLGRFRTFAASRRKRPQNGEVYFPCGASILPAPRKYTSRKRGVRHAKQPALAYQTPPSATTTAETRGSLTKKLFLRLWRKFATKLPKTPK